MIVETPIPPYYAVIFTSILNKDAVGYEEEVALVMNLAQQQEGFLGMESARGSVGITVSYWTNLEAIKKWSEHARHKVAKEKGIANFYSVYKTRISKVEKEY
ncbi:MAG: heme-degrading monooxygenase HmoA [Salibacteraceae bacterium]|jgi:heme-degrading monooxygenase HmoA